MAAIDGEIGSCTPSAATATDIRAVPASKKAVGVVAICNKSTTVTATVRVSLSGTTNTEGTAFLCHGVVLGPSGGGSNMAYISPVAVGASKFLVAYSDVANVSFVYDGREEDI